MNLYKDNKLKEFKDIKGNTWFSQGFEVIPLKKKNGIKQFKIIERCYKSILSKNL